MSIIVKTQIGAGGKWIKEGEWAKGPKNLLAAVKCAQAAAAENRGVGGYRTIIEIDGVVLSHIESGWPATMAEARAALA